VSYTLQLYFDFSGYSDMALGLARMFGILLPINFHSPLRAASIIEYWRRWHMTLQRFIVTYVYTPLSVPLNRFAIERDLPAERFGSTNLRVKRPDWELEITPKFDSPVVRPAVHDRRRHGVKASFHLPGHVRGRPEACNSAHDVFLP